MHLQLVFNELSGTSLRQHLNFLDATGDFHEKSRLFFYPLIFEGLSADQLDWKQFEPEYFKQKENYESFRALFPLLLASIIMLILCSVIVKKL